MPFGLNNTPAVFQALVNHVLCDMLNRLVFVHLDDILIFSQIQEQHLQCAHLILQRLLENKLYVKVDKCHFHSPSEDFPRFVIEWGQVKMDPTNVKWRPWLIADSWKHGNSIVSLVLPTYIDEALFSRLPSPGEKS